MKNPTIQIRLPRWMDDFLLQSEKSFPTADDRMGFVLSLARENVAAQTGGPFAAAVFDSEGRVVAPGVNLVASGTCSILHAEIVALTLAQLGLRRYDLGVGGRLTYELVSLCEPCTMCLGAIIWSGASHIVCGARDEDARAIGFDEGPKPADWILELEKRGIIVRRDVRRKEAAELLRHYAEAGGLIYNPGRAARTGSGSKRRRS